MTNNSSSFNSVTKFVAYAAVSTAVVLVATMIGVPFAQFYFNVGDTIILITSALYGPLMGMIAGGIGSFFADMIVYPTTMFYTLIIKALEGLIAGSLLLLIRKKVVSVKLQLVLSAVAMAVSAFFMMFGYFVCNTFFYGSYEAALVAIPMDALQATISFVLSYIILFVFRLIKLRKDFF